MPDRHSVPVRMPCRRSHGGGGLTSVAPLAAKLAKGYLKAFPRSVAFRLAQGGSDIGVADVARGRVTIGNSSRDPKPTDPGGLVFNKIARDAICIITNNANPLGNLSQAQVQDIFSGKVRDWGQVPGATVSGTIDLIVRTAASGTQDAFQKIFMGTAKVAGSAAQKASNGLVQQAVKSDQNAIGYVSLAFTGGRCTRPLQRASHATCATPSPASTAACATSGWSLAGPATGAAKKWIKWISQQLGGPRRSSPPSGCRSAR